MSNIQMVFVEVKGMICFGIDDSITSPHCCQETALTTGGPICRRVCTGSALTCYENTLLKVRNFATIKGIITVAFCPGAGASNSHCTFRSSR